MAMMNSLPEPSELVEDEIASMKIRFQKEGLLWDTLSQEDKLLQVWRWLADSETNLRTLRIKTEKINVQNQGEKEELAAQLSVERIGREKLEQELDILSLRLEEFDDKNRELEEDNRNLALSLKKALLSTQRNDMRELHQAVNQQIDSLIARIEALSDRHKKTKLNYRANLQLHQVQHQEEVERLVISLKEAEIKITSLEETLATKVQLLIAKDDQLEGLRKEQQDSNKQSLQLAEKEVQ